ncbi:hypothetical protein NUU61_007053 [Penicillium alfredii]|uniref:Yeast cell wall synthesis Kre9/Knh1-like N-terminal domain-containing protein n=1 Tax=Penicillium alfredii TaxID=1506179 RepID=A0A9W9F1Z7_9EURO|nr:uncharacterized protein NUU61_007053 [Penicillium alfredii]KAJ5092183.1 hypothetical protein NUU61_007053 [Penicillium alfredii]
MRAFLSLVIALFAAVVAASSRANPFNIPDDGYTFETGKPTTLTWQQTTGGTVTLRLQWGAVTTATSGTVIASNIDNSGSFTWHVPENLEAQPDYTIEILSDANTGDYNFLPRFTVQGAKVGASSSSPSDSSSDSAPSTTSESTTSTSAPTTSATPTSTSSESESSSTSSPTTMVTKTSSASSSSTSSTSSSSDSSSSSSTPTSSSSASASASQTAVPTTNAGIANRVSGGMLAVVLGAIAVM